MTTAPENTNARTAHSRGPYSPTISRSRSVNASGGKAPAASATPPAWPEAR